MSGRVGGNSRCGCPSCRQYDGALPSPHCVYRFSAKQAPAGADVDAPGDTAGTSNGDAGGHGDSANDKVAAGAARAGEAFAIPWRTRRGGIGDTVADQASASSHTSTRRRARKGKERRGGAKVNKATQAPVDNEVSGGQHGIQPKLRQMGKGKAREHPEAHARYKAELRHMSQGLRESYFRTYHSFRMAAERVVDKKDRQATLAQNVEASLKAWEAGEREGSASDQPDRNERAITMPSPQLLEGDASGRVKAAAKPITFTVPSEPPRCSGEALRSTSGVVLFLSSLVGQAEGVSYPTCPVCGEQVVEIGGHIGISSCGDVTKPAYRGYSLQCVVCTKEYPAHKVIEHAHECQGAPPEASMSVSSSTVAGPGEAATSGRGRRRAALVALKKITDAAAILNEDTSTEEPKLKRRKK